MIVAYSSKVIRSAFALVSFSCSLICFVRFAPEVKAQQAAGTCSFSNQVPVIKRRLDQLGTRAGLSGSDITDSFEEYAVKSYTNSVVPFTGVASGGTQQFVDSTTIAWNGGAQLKFESPQRAILTNNTQRNVAPDGVGAVARTINGVLVGRLRNLAFFDAKALTSSTISPSDSDWQILGFFDAVNEEREKLSVINPLANRVNGLIPAVTFLTTYDVSVGPAARSEATLNGVGVWQSHLCEDFFPVTPNNLQMGIPVVLNPNLYIARDYDPYFGQAAPFPFRLLPPTR